MRSTKFLVPLQDREPLQNGKTVRRAEVYNSQGNAKPDGKEEFVLGQNETWIDLLAKLSDLKRPYIDDFENTAPSTNGVAA